MDNEHLLDREHARREVEAARERVIEAAKAWDSAVPDDLKTHRELAVAVRALRELEGK